MIEILKNWKGAVEINGQLYDNIQTATSQFKLGSGEICIKLYPESQKPVKANPESVQPVPVIQHLDGDKYRITVKKYMTEKATAQFDFMEKWNNNNPMPLRTMTGKVLKETRGMVQMELHGDIWAERVFTCMCCGRQLTNPVSQYFGIGPECGGHNYTHPFSSDKELKDAVNAYRTKLQAITWTGWIIKSAITEQIDLTEEN